MMHQSAQQHRKAEHACANVAHMLVMLRMTPLRRASMPGSSARVSSIGARRFTSRIMAASSADSAAKSTTLMDPAAQRDASGRDVSILRCTPVL
jgi:hypothetical protein